MSRAEGPHRMTRSTKERTKIWYDKEIKKECDMGDKMLMNSSSKESFKQEEKDHHKSSNLHYMVSSRSKDEGNILR
jgi:hypothetical protein